MKYLVLSDTHSKINRASRLYQEAGDFDGIIHLGDTGAVRLYPDRIL